jgi:RES domain-containing protein|uniref:RES family NAD+ phosphorylase n=1 Tax=Cephaloticoccus sp. TaxID=1985742 RepID=UPI00404A2C8A
MPIAWRLVKEVHAPTAFGGEGAARAGGRWNSRGQHVVYASATQSLAVLEALVHLDFPIVFHYVFFRIEFADRLITTLGDKSLPRDWQTNPPAAASQKLGDLWLQMAHSPVLAVPSAVVPTETNFVLNPSHPDFKQIKISKPVPFTIDDRLQR